MRRWVIIVSLVMVMSVGPALPIEARSSAESTSESEQAHRQVSDTFASSQASSLAADTITASSSTSASDEQSLSASASSTVSASSDQQASSSQKTSSSSASSQQLDSQSVASTNTASEASTSSSATSQPSDQQHHTVHPTAPATEITQANDALAPAKVTTEVKVFDEHGRELSAGKIAANNTQIRYRFKLTHQAGTAPTRKVSFRFAAPPEIKLSQAELQTKQGRVANIAVDGQSVVEYELPVQLSDKNEWSIIEVTGLTKSGRQPIIRGGSASYQVDKGQRLDIPLPTYMLLEYTQIELTLAQQHFRVKRTEKLKITGRVNRKTPIVGHNMEIVVMAQDKELTTKVLEEEVVKVEDGYENKFTIEVAADQLSTGKQELTVFAKDKHKIISKNVTVNVQVIENLGFKNVPQRVQFKPVMLTGKTQVTGRQADWQVQVNDDQSNWRLLAAATTFSDTTKGDLAGELVYQNGQHTQPITARGTVIATAQTQPHFDSDQAWQAQTGILLKTRPDAVPGAYQGKITWTLESVPDDQ